MPSPIAQERRSSDPPRRFAIFWSITIQNASDVVGRFCSPITEPQSLILKITFAEFTATGARVEPRLYDAEIAPAVVPQLWASAEITSSRKTSSSTAIDTRFAASVVQFSTNDLMSVCFLSMGFVTNAQYLPRSMVSSTVSVS